MMISKEEYDKQFLEITQQLAKLTAAAIENIAGIQIMYEALAYELGYIDGISCLSNIKREDRNRSKETFFKAGKQMAHDAHIKHHCDLKKCIESETLDLELNGN